jgi:hypothetical protein
MVNASYTKQFLRAFLLFSLFLFSAVQNILHAQWWLWWGIWELINDVRFCTWFYGGCWIQVWEYFVSIGSQAYWSMWIFCLDPYVNVIWYGAGGWGGDCQTLWLNPPF